MRRLAWIPFLVIALASGCGGTNASVEAGWGLIVRVRGSPPHRSHPSDSAGETTPEAAIAVFVSNPVVRLPAGGWERADFIATEQGTVPLTVSVPQAAFVRRDGDRIDMVLTLEQLPAGWQVTGAHHCAD